MFAVTGSVAATAACGESTARRATHVRLRSADGHGHPDGARRIPSAAQQLAEGLRRVRRGQHLQGRSGEAAGRGVQGLDRAQRGDRLADHLRRRAALVELRDLPDRRHAGRHRPGAEPRPGRSVLRDLRRRPRPSAAQAHGRPAEVQLLRRRHAGQVAAVRDQADEAGRHRAVDARAAVPAEGPGRRATRARSSRRTSSRSA